MADKNRSTTDIKYSIWETRTDEKHSHPVNKQKEAIDSPAPKDNN